MPVDNRFRHQAYTSAWPQVPYRLLCPHLPPQPGTLAFQQGMARFGKVLSEVGVAAIYLVHGTFTGNDAFGLIREVGRWLPDAAETLERQRKQLVDSFMTESGNYTQQFASLLQQALNADQTCQKIEVRLFRWSSENHHSGRAVAACDLANEIQQRFGQARRIMLWGHSHAGNVFALLTHLNSSTETSELRQFRRIIRTLKPPVAANVSPTDAHSEVSLGPSFPALDIVTFGTPIRYGWETSGYESLLHFVHHQPDGSLPDADYLSALHGDWSELGKRIVESGIPAGDWVHQIGVAGSNFWPYLLSWRKQVAERALRTLIEQGIRRRDLIARLRLGQRVPSEGTTFLVDYQDSPNQLEQQMLGHAVYTRTEWLYFHMEKITHALCNSKKDGNAG